MNNYIPNVVVIYTKPPKHYKNTVSYPMYEVGNYVYFGDASKEISTWYKIRPGFIGSGFSLESIEKPLHYVRVTGNRLVLTRRRLLYGETLQEWYLSATFSFEDDHTIINGLTKQCLQASSSPSSTNNFPLISDKLNTSFREEPCIFSMKHVEVPVRQRYMADRIYLVNGLAANCVVTYMEDMSMFVEIGSEGVMLRIVTDTTARTVKFESVTHPGYFMSYGEHRIKLRNEADKNTFLVKQGFLGENTFLLQCAQDGFEKLFLQSEDTYWKDKKRVMRLSIARVNPQQECSRKNSTFSVKRVPE